MAWGWTSKDQATHHLLFLVIFGFRSRYGEGFSNVVYDIYYVQNFGVEQELIL
ncbi:hypothetical protein HanRHA438_Chr17g0820261 [Helianthus annuus]|nr:hypothetical protein HanRHA438_Chr17g0820261 [Helianthus annuus]